MQYMNSFPTYQEWLNEEGDIEYVDSPIPVDQDRKMDYLAYVLNNCFDEIIEDQEIFTDSDITRFLNALHKA